MGNDLFEKMISVSHLFECWDQFKRGKRKRKDIQVFERHLEDHVFQLHEDLASGSYKHGPYHLFYVFDPKERNIAKASVRDRLVHHMLHASLDDLFDGRFIFHSLSSRVGKGVHVGLDHLERMIRKVSGNGTKRCYGLKIDVRRFFDSMDHNVLKTLIRKKVDDKRVLHLTDQVIDSFCCKKPGVGLPLANVTSQLFANIYLHPLDQFMKQVLRLPYYLRYCDDLMVLSYDRHVLETLIVLVRNFLHEHLRLELHPKKVSIRPLSQGIDFVGYLFFSKYRLMRTATKKRMKRRLKKAYVEYLSGKLEAEGMNQSLQSYLGLLSHANQFNLSRVLMNAYGIRREAMDGKPAS